MLPSQPARVSLVMTVLNEAMSLPDLLASIDGQTQPPDEIVIADGGSIDGTVDVLRRWGEGRGDVSVISAPGASISQGRNVAIQRATGDVIAVTDAGVILGPAWLERLAGTLEAEPAIDVAGGFFVADARSLFDRAMGATVLPALGDIDASAFLPSSRSVAFRRRAWERVGGYPGWLDYCEDLVFDLALKEAGLRFAWVPDAVVSFRTRPNLRSFFVQYFRYARGDGKADLWRKRHALRYAAYACAALVAWRPSVLGIAAGLAGGVWYVSRPIQRFVAFGQATPGMLLGGLALVPLIRLTGDLAKMAGYPVGWAWRLRHSRDRM